MLQVQPDVQNVIHIVHHRIFREGGEGQRGTVRTTMW